MTDIKIEIVPESKCPTCDGGDEFFNRPKVGTEDGWWWRCYNPACETEYYFPVDGREPRQWKTRIQTEVWKP